MLKKDVKYFNEVSENVIEFDLKNFVNNQMIIYEKFPIPNTDGSFINRFDKILMHIIEEVQEVSMSKNYSEMIFEVIDVLMYLGTLYLTLEDYAFLIRDNAFITRNYIINLDSHQDRLEYCETILNDVVSSLISIRRMFPERKWHKPVVESQLLKNRYHITSNIILKNITSVSSLLVYLTDDCKEQHLNHKLNMKQGLINSLDK